MDSLLRDVYYNLSSPAAYGGVSAIYKEAKRRDPLIKFSDVENFLQRQDTYTLHKPIRRNFDRNRMVAVGIDSDWQADLCDVQKIQKHNDGYNYILTVIDVLSKFAWAVPIRNKKPETVAQAFDKILKSSGRKPWRLYTDNGTEFRGKPFQDFLFRKDIQYISSQSPDVKAAVAERYNRTLKTRLWKHFSHKSTLRYVDALPRIVDAINHSYHRSIKRRPVDVTRENESEVYQTLYGKVHGRLSEKKSQAKFKFEIGDKVRIGKYKHVFAKGYLPNFTEEIFTVTNRFDKQPPVYKICDYLGEAVSGIFYESELVKVVKPDEIYKIEKILKTRRGKGGVVEHLVKWLGYPTKFNQWIPRSDLKTI